MVYDFVWPVYVGDAKGDTLAVFSLKENSIHNESLKWAKMQPWTFDSHVRSAGGGGEVDKNHSPNLSIVIQYFLNLWSTRKNNISFNYNRLL